MIPSETLPPELRVDGLWWRKFAWLGSVYGPEWWKRYSPPVIAAIIFSVVGRNRRGCIANMRRVVGDRVPGAAALAALRTFVEFANCMTETLEYFGPKPHPVQVDLPEADLVEKLIADGRGLVVVTGHFGNWDLAAKRLLSYGRPVHVVMAREANASMHRYQQQLRESASIRIVFSDTSLFSTLNLVHALRANEVVAMQLDRTPPQARTVDVPFFGAPAHFAAGPFHLARVARSPLITAFAVRMGVRHYEIRLGSAYDVPQWARGKRLASVAAQAVADFEAIVREFPVSVLGFLGRAGAHSSAAAIAARA
ncbi:MAG TPA: lysophospholipid acyltransferase family protein [Candidatus Limnocylindrales bacterium]|nr:lysophospholipid acyltransferase family protein [Candidatus Limnocylindrales bacterium]